MTTDPLRRQLTNLLRGGDAARPTLELMREYPYEKAGIVPDDLPYASDSGPRVVVGRLLGAW